MFKGKSIACVIPARLESTRLPRKVLLDVHGYPLLYWTYQAAKNVVLFDDIIVAIDDEESQRIANALDIPTIMTSKAHPSGTDRLIDVKNRCAQQYDVWVNWQADEPLVTEAMIKDLLSSVDQPDASIWTLRTANVDAQELDSMDVVKVSVDCNDRALDFSRQKSHTLREKHVGLYAYCSSVLDEIQQLEPTQRELTERLEQLRFLEHGIPMKAHRTPHCTLGIDTLEDFEQLKCHLQLDGPSQTH